MKTFTAISTMKDETKKTFKYVIKAKNMASAVVIANDTFDLRYCTVEVFEGNLWTPINY